MGSIVLVIHVFLAATVIGLVLIQHGKGADAGAAFGSGASATVFGARGSGSFLTRLTTAAVTLFFATSLTLFYLAAQRPAEIGSVIDSPPVPEASVVIPTEPEVSSSQQEDVPTVEE